MQYLQASFHLHPYSEAAGDVLCAFLGEIGFESFVATNDGVEAYIQKKLFNPCALNSLINDFPLPCAITFETTPVATTNWNEEWEKHGFSPICHPLFIIHDPGLTQEERARLHASTFPDGQGDWHYDITIRPMMSFGSGSHATTRQIVEQLMDLDLDNKDVLDMGCGTGILGIVAALRGARHVTAIDIDDICAESTRENARLNGIDNMEVALGDASMLQHYGPFDLILANIHKNIILRDMENYVARLKDNAIVVFSGFFEEDTKEMVEKGLTLGLSLNTITQRDGWAVVEMRR
mgnify:CR=1 FL=1